MNFRRHRHEEPEINLIPFIDVLLVILIFLMLSTTYSRFTELQLTLPSANAEPMRERPGEIVVAIASDGRTTINWRAVEGRSVELLTAELAAAAGGARRHVADRLGRRAGHAPIGDQRARCRAARRTGAPELCRAVRRGQARTLSVAWADRIEPGLARLWWHHKASAAALCLTPLSWCYSAVTAVRRFAFRSGWLKVERAPVPVIVVGNLVVGGAGKTPTVMALAQALRNAGYAPGVISRGHHRRGADAAAVTARSDARKVGDEPLLIHRRTLVPVWVARRRIDAARALCAAHAEVDVLLADDGLQHLRLARDVQVMVFDDRGVGNGRLLPAGPLRERLPLHVPVNTHVLYNAPRASTALPGATARRALAGAVLLQDWWAGAAARIEALHALRGQVLHAAAGMAAPQRFFDMLRAEGLAFSALPLPDHFAFDTLPWPRDGADVLVTEKDAVKLNPASAAAGSTRIWVVALDFRLPDDFIAAVLDNLRLAYRP